MKIGTILLTSAAFMLCAPIVSPEFSSGAAFAKSDKSSSKGKKKSAEKKKKSKSSGSSKPEAPKAKPAPAGGPKAQVAPKPKNVHAQLGSMNSLKRNINGIMNSSDPKMEPIKAFILASAALVGLEADEAAAIASAQSALTAYTDLATPLGLSADPSLALAEIEALRASLVEPLAGTPEYEAYQAQLAALSAAELAAVQANAAQYDATQATLLADAGRAAAGEDALMQSIVDAINATGKGGLTIDDLTPEMLEFAKTQLGFEDQEGAIDDYIAALDAAEPDLLEVEGDPEVEQTSVETPTEEEPV